MYVIMYVNLFSWAQVLKSFVELFVYSWNERYILLLLSVAISMLCVSKQHNEKYYFISDQSCHVKLHKNFSVSLI